MAARHWLLFIGAPGTLLPKQSEWCFRAQGGETCQHKEEVGGQLGPLIAQFLTN
jgi:hypothetical protein